MADAGSPDTLEKHQREVCNAFARAAAAMRDAAQTAETFSNWFSRVNNVQNIPLPPMFNNGLYNFMPNYGGPQQQQYQMPLLEPEQTGGKRKTAGDQDGKRKRQLKEKKPKDANAPKRPPSAYLLFQNEIRSHVKEEHPEMTYNQILSEISKLWHAMSVEDKAPYQQATEDSKALYQKAKADYDAHSPTADTTKANISDNKTSVTAVASAIKPAAQPAVAGEDSSVEPSEASSSDDDTSEEEEEEEESDPIPEPPRKKSKKETAKVPTPPSTKVEKKKQSGEGKKKKKADT